MSVQAAVNEMTEKVEKTKRLEDIAHITDRFDFVKQALQLLGSIHGRSTAIVPSKASSQTPSRRT